MNWKLASTVQRETSGSTYDMASPFQNSANTKYLTYF